MTVTPYQKSPNGQATVSSYLLTFDTADDSQKKAWEVAQQLAAQRKLKHVLTGFLLSVHTVQEQTGKQIDLMEFMAQFITNMVVGGKAMPRITEEMHPEELPTMFTGTDDHSDPMEARQVFAVSMGSLFDEDEDNIWDD